MTVGNTISKAIKEGKWININYQQKDAVTIYWIAVIDIVDFENRILKVLIYNDKKSLNTIETCIKFDKIISAKVIEMSMYETPSNLIYKIEKNLIRCGWLNYDKFNHNILNYYKECSYLDCDPFFKEFCMVPGVDLQVLRKQKVYKLNEEQTRIILQKIYHFDIKNENNSVYDLVVSRLSIDKGQKKYLLCYYDVFFNPDKMTLVLSHRLKFNKSFLIEGRKHSLFNYVGMNVDSFIENFEENYDERRSVLLENFHHEEILNDRPEFLLLEREFNVDLTSTYDEIERKYAENELNTPLKSFFGNISKQNNRGRKEPSIVIYDNKINIDQMRVIYNAMKYPVTYVQGPPGTGKTHTILNVILSSFFADKTVLVCSSNNKPIDGILEKLDFKYRNENVLFPFLRLGKLEDVIKATQKIRLLYEFKTDKIVKEDLINKIKVNADNANGELVKLLEKQERRILLEEYIVSFNKLLENIPDKECAFADNIKLRINQLQDELDTLPVISNAQVIKLFSPIKDSREMLQFLYFQSLGYIKKLQEPKYKSLIKICYTEDEETRAIEFNKWTQKSENMKILNNVFPIIFSTNISSYRLGEANYTFDLVIMDEAGQSNVAHALIPINKAKSLLLVGDPNQLKPVIILEESVNSQLMEKYKIDEEYNYKENSILDVMLEHDNISKYIFLKYHYRCGRKIIGFSNDRYYKSRLNLSFIQDEGSLEFLNIKSVNVMDKNSAFEEAKGIVDYIKRNNLQNVSIVTPFVNQQTLINRLLVDSKIENVKCGTIHSLQGAENDTIILSLAISPKTSRQTYAWMQNNIELINVGATRAKNKLIIAGDEQAVSKLSDGKDDLYQLVKYVINSGNSIVPPSESIKIEIGLSNGSKNEDEFFKTVAQFCSVHNTYEVKRNVKVSTLFKDDDSLKTSKQEFDTVIYEKKLFGLKPIIAIELNGGEHFGDAVREYNDKKKKLICDKKGIKLIVIPNSFIKSYEYMKELIIGSKNKKAVQMSLFDIDQI